MNEQPQGIAGYQFLAGCNFFRREMPNRKSDRMSVDDFRRIAEYKLGMKLDREETLALFDTLVPGTGETVGIADMVCLLKQLFLESVSKCRGVSPKIEEGFSLVTYRCLLLEE